MLLREAPLLPQRGSMPPTATGDVVPATGQAIVPAKPHPGIWAALAGCC